MAIYSYTSPPKYGWHHELMIDDDNDDDDDDDYDGRPTRGTHSVQMRAT